jgi:hypothetical protein
MRGLFQNPALAGVFPQFGKGETERPQNAPSYAETERRVQSYLAAALNGSVTGDGEITVKGKHQTVLNRVRLLQPLIEGLFDNAPKVAAAVRKDAPLYLPYATRKQIEDLKSPAGKTRALSEAVDNLQYNAALGALNGVKNEPPAQFERNRREWETKVGMRLKRI